MTLKIKNMTSFNKQLNSSITLLLLLLSSFFLSSCSLNICYTFPITGSCPTCSSAAESAFSHINEFITDSEFSPTQYMNDDAGSPIVGLENVQKMVHEQNSVGLIGALNSKVTLALGYYLTYRGIPIVTISTNPQISDVTDYPTVMRVTPSDADWSGYIGAAVTQLNWKRVGIIHTDDAYASYQARSVVNSASTYDLEVVRSVVFSYGLTGDSDTRSIIKEQLQTLKDQYIFVFVFLCVSDDAKIVLEEAHKLGMFGNEQYSWISSDGAGDALFQNWDYLTQYPDIARGMFALTFACKQDSIELRKMAEDIAPLGLVPTPQTCYAYDAFLSSYTALEKTSKYMKSEGVDLQCLEYDFYYQNLTYCKHDSVGPNIEMLVRSRAKCDESECVHCGVCTILDQFNTGVSSEMEFHYYQLLYFSDLYGLEIEGASGNIRFKSDGSRVPSDITYLLRNSVTFSDKPPEFVEIAKLSVTNNVASLTLSDENQLIFSGGSQESPNLIRNEDRPPVQTVETSNAIRYTIFAFTGLCLVLCFLALIVYYHYRETQIIKSSTPLMMYCMMLGGIFTYGAALSLVALEINTDATCIVHQWLRHLGFILLFLPILLKTQRIKSIFTKDVKKNTDFHMPTSLLMKWLLLGVASMIIYLIIWTVVGNPGVQSFVDERIQGDIIEVKCRVDWWLYILLVVEFLIVLYSVILGFYVYKVPAFYNESKQLVFGVYNWFVTNTLIQFIVVIISLQVEVAIVLISSSLIISNTILLTTFFLVKFYQLWSGKDKPINKIIKNMPKVDATTQEDDYDANEQVGGETLEVLTSPKNSTRRPSILIDGVYDGVRGSTQVLDV